MAFGPVIHKAFEPIKIVLENGEVWFSSKQKKAGFIRYFTRILSESPEFYLAELKHASKRPNNGNFQYYLTFKK